MAPNAGAERAFSFMMALGISKEEVKPVLIKLLRVYEGNWELIEDDNYRTLVDAYFDFEKEKVVEGERKPNASGHGQKSTGKPFLVDGDDRALSKIFEQKNVKPSQTFTEDDRPQTSSQALHSTMSEAKKISNLPRGSAKDRPEKASSARHRGQIEMNPVKRRAKKPKLLTSTNHNGDLCVKPPSNQDQDLQSKNPVPDCINNTRAYNGNITIASSSHLEEVKLSLNCESALAGLNFRIPDLAIVMKFMDKKYLSSSKTADPQFSTAKLLDDLCSIFLKLGLRKGSNSNLANSDTQYASLEERKAFNFISDITKGSEKVKISLIDEFGGEVLPKFNYIPCNIIYQSATVTISLARISDEGCCSDCSGDCLSSSLPCACARETGGEFAYTPQGLLKEEFLTACATMKTDPKDHHFVYCQECPLEKSKNEYMPERCKGHMVRKFIKECWRKCGCDMLCGNRIVQRGIACKLQVFLTREGKGWGLRTLEDLPKGTFVCEYIGEILTNMELYDRIMHESGNDRHTYPVTLDADWGSEKGLKDEEALCLDATYNGNVGRFINHRCYDANLIDIPVEIESPDHHYYHLAFFTNRNVSAYEELTWDYGIDFDDTDHPIKAFRCSCGSAFCHDKKQKEIMGRKGSGINWFQSIDNERAEGNRPGPSAGRAGGQQHTPAQTVEPAPVVLSVSPDKTVVVEEQLERKRKVKAVGTSGEAAKKRKEGFGETERPLPLGVWDPAFTMGRKVELNMDSSEKKVVENMSEQEIADTMLEMTTRAQMLAWHLAYASDRGKLRVELEKTRKQLKEITEVHAVCDAKQKRSEQLLREAEVLLNDSRDAGLALRKERDQMSSDLEQAKKVVATVAKERDDWRAEALDSKELVEELKDAIMIEHTRGFQKAIRQVGHLLEVSTEGVAFDIQKDVHEGQMKPLNEIPEDAFLEAEEDEEAAANDKQDEVVVEAVGDAADGAPNIVID